MARPTWENSASWAVVKVSAKPPASAHDRPSGTGRRWRSWTTASSAIAPPPTTAMTRSPSVQPVTPGAEADDLAGQLEAGDVGGGAGRGRVEAHHLEAVGGVDPGGADADQDLAGAGRGVGALVPDEFLVDDGVGVHRRSRRPSAGRSARSRARRRRCRAGGAGRCFWSCSSSSFQCASQPGRAGDGEQHGEHLESGSPWPGR